MANFPGWTGTIPGVYGFRTKSEIKIHGPEYEVLTDSDASILKISGNKKLAALAIVKYVEEQMIELEYSSIGLGPFVFYKQQNKLVVDNNYKNTELENLPEMLDMITNVLKFKAFF